MRILFLALTTLLTFYTHPSFAQNQDNNNFEDLFTGLDAAMIPVKNRSVLNSTDNEINPRLGTICEYIYRGRSSLIEEVLYNQKHVFREKEESGIYYSDYEILSDFKCRKEISGGFSPSNTNEEYRFTLVEFAILFSENGGIETVTKIFKILDSLPQIQKRKVLFEKNKMGLDLVEFTEDVIRKYDYRLTLGGYVNDEHDASRLQLNNIKQELLKLRENRY